MDNSNTPNIVVFGSCMIDLICYSPRLPKPGETIHGNDFKVGNGGKGANQCVAAAKLGGTTALIARVGNDSFGIAYKENLKTFDVNTDFVLLTENIPSGMAQITVSDEGENVIVIVPGANNCLSADDALNAQKFLLGSKVVVFQFEVPIESSVRTLQIIKSADTRTCTIVNGAPALKNVNLDVFALCDIFCVNESEAEELTGIKVDSVEKASTAVERLLSLGCNVVIITLGKDGAIFSEAGGEIIHVDAPSVTPVDTTGAGDAFIGALAFFTAYYPELSLKSRISKSCAIASISVQTKGTQTSFPYRKDLPKELFLENSVTYNQ